ncbi:MAG: hypothetical protein V3V82_02190 [Acidimicrobiia bacterium]
MSNPKSGPGYHPVMHPNVLRGLVALAVLAILAVSAIPLLILLDLSGNGTGWGLCEAGLDTCRVGPFRGARLAALLLTVLFAMAGLLRFIVWIASRSARRNTVPASTTDFFIPE